MFTAFVMMHQYGIVVLGKEFNIYYSMEL